MDSRKGTPHLSDAHLGYQTSCPAADMVINLVLDPVRLQDREDCPHYLSCLAKSAGTVAGSKGKRSVCYGCKGEPRPESIAALIALVAAKWGTRITAITRGCKDGPACKARREVWERGNLYGYTDAELARATGVTPQTVGEWLDQPRRKR